MKNVLLWNDEPFLRGLSIMLESVLWRVAGLVIQLHALYVLHAPVTQAEAALTLTSNPYR